MGVNTHETLGSQLEDVRLPPSPTLPPPGSRWGRYQGAMGTRASAGGIWPPPLPNRIAPHPPEIPSKAALLPRAAGKTTALYQGARQRVNTTAPRQPSATTPESCKDMDHRSYACQVQTLRTEIHMKPEPTRPTNRLCSNKPPPTLPKQSLSRRQIADACSTRLRQARSGIQYTTLHHTSWHVSGRLNHGLRKCQVSELTFSEASLPTSKFEHTQHSGATPHYTTGLKLPPFSRLFPPPPTPLHHPQPCRVSLTTSVAICHTEKRCHQGVPNHFVSARLP